MEDVEISIEEALKLYAGAKTEAKKLEELIDKLQPQIKEYIEKQGVDKLPTSVGIFSVSPTSRWKYSSAVEKLQEQEKATGIAKQVTTISLRFTPPKEV